MDEIVEIPINRVRPKRNLVMAGVVSSTPTGGNFKSLVFSVLQKCQKFLCSEAEEFKTVDAKQHAF